MFPAAAAAASPPGSLVKPTIISNIRLGNTPEQTSYFTTSIDAINRELKELRRQRLAMASSCDEDKPSAERNPALDLGGPSE